MQTTNVCVTTPGSVRSARAVGRREGSAERLSLSSNFLNGPRTGSPGVHQLVTTKIREAVGPTSTDPVGNAEYSQSLLSEVLTVLALNSLREEPQAPHPAPELSWPQNSRSSTSSPRTALPTHVGERPLPSSWHQNGAPWECSQVLRPQTHRFLPVLKAQSRCHPQPSWVRPAVHLGSQQGAPPARLHICGAG